MVKEEWRDIKEYEGLYQVSSCGRVKSFDIIQNMKNGVDRRKKGRILRLRTDGRGKYILVGLFKNKKPRTHLVHRLVASSFIGSISGLEVNHKNGIWSDNRVDNLEIVTKKQNEWHKVNILKRVNNSAKGRFGILNGRSKKVKQSMDGVVIREWDSICEAHRKLGFDPSSIVKCCKGKMKTHKGYQWEYSIN